jgi:hypothetical protein
MTLIRCLLNEALVSHGFSVSSPGKAELFHVRPTFLRVAREHILVFFGRFFDAKKAFCGII